MAIKLDMSNAFDRIEWSCLERIMEKLGFHHRWISLMMMCKKSVSYSVLLNGEPKGLIHLTKGIRQGDPISLYLFLLCSEGLLAMLKREESLGHINGILVCRRAPRISHLLLADDSLIFCRANMIECSNIWTILREYKMVAGQKMNREKHPCFSARTQLWKSKIPSTGYLERKLLSNMNNTWDYLPWSAKGKKKLSTKLKTKWGRRL